MVVLIGGAALIWWQLGGSRQDLRISFLLTHIEAEGGGLRLGRDRLIALGWQVFEPGVQGSRLLRHGRFDYRRGEAPEATAPAELSWPGPQGRLVVWCRFDLGPTASPGLPAESTVALAPDPNRTDLQVVDVGSCGRLSLPGP
jgi:hypothetical protein